MESKFVQTPSGRIHAVFAGKGKTVLLIHGRSTEVNSWRTWEKNIDALAERSRVVAFDLLGFGESDKPEPFPDARSQARALIEFMDVSVPRIERASLVGLSWGGAIAQIIAATHPSRVYRLVLVDSSYENSAKGLARLGQITRPTLILWDADDAVIPVETAQILGEAIPKSRVRVFTRDERDPDADWNNRHWSQVSHSHEWNHEVLEFLGK